MTGLPLYDAVVPTLIRGLQSFDHVLTRAEEYAKEKGQDVNEFTQARLVEDQLPFAFQVQNASKAAQVAAGRLTGTEPTFFENNEKTFEDLRKRIQKTLDELKALDPAAINARAGEQVDLLIPWAGTTQKVPVEQAVLTHNFPNFYFHLTTGYSILRAKGVPLGKRDFLESFLGY
ncbi:hypothetical protein B0J13DRAFT_587516 [Dactylonectria estremocensis]|uniref:DUF1993 domain-containing protein n=1 Tax=Dactylonectria estremocensis TaxID=1079267 RepID=A0A9P9IWD0_9HYPO|nr:hypothetical protein B0J13DRAFT_587516 [Dactylonectria estremocensis]